MRLSIKSLLAASAGLTILLLSLVLLCTFQLQRALATQAQAESQRYQSYLLANELRQSSDGRARNFQRGQSGSEYGRPGRTTA
ncbi:hypothetical protein ABH309_13945 [Chromobacterium piscinae]|uniref:Uncharacterized protein n=1 Tax=Chromobacterium piscinae TaxID=686831 RepID=A0ABV0H8C7_9NEIS